MAPRAQKPKEPEPWDPPVLVPYSRLQELLHTGERCDKLEQQCRKFRQEIDGINGRLSEIIDRIADLARMI